MSERLIIHDLRTRNLGPEDNAHLKIGRKAVDDYVTSFSIQNQGRNSVLQIWKDGNKIELRPFEPPFTVGVEWPCILDTSLTLVWVEENQMQFPSDGSARASVDTAPVDVSAEDALYHNAVLVETFVKQIC